jgi:hypothetical protein
VRVLIACEFSGVVREAFRARGHDAWSCDLLPSEDDSPNHIQGNAFDLLDDNWDMMIAHPSCTYLCNSGVRWLHTKPGRWTLMEKAANDFKRFLDCRIKRKAVENPVMHKYATAIIGRRADQFVQPWWFGHPEIKATGFHLDGLPPLKPTQIVAGRYARVHRASPSPDRWKERSRTLMGIGKAAAEQWG